MKLRLLILALIGLYYSPAQSSYLGFSCMALEERENRKGPHEFFEAKLIRGHCSYKDEAMHYTMQLPVGQTTKEKKKQAIIKYMAQFKPVICSPAHNTWDVVDHIIFEFFDENERFMYSYQVNREDCL
jgi:hypothetical protein